MVDVHPDQYFHFKNGRHARNVWDLRRELELISDQEYNEHVTSEKNDFATWISEVLQDRPLAEKMRKATNRHDAIDITRFKINEITNELGKSHIVSDFELVKDFLIGLGIGIIIGIGIGVLVL